MNRKRKYIHNCQKLILRYIIIFCSLFYIILPLLFHNSLSLQVSLVFKSFQETHDSNLLSEPENFSVDGAVQIYVNFSKNERIGLWAISAEDNRSEKVKIGCDKLFCNNKTTIFYLHGSTGHRGKSYRVELYKTLRSFGYNIVTFDYRGFGDSSDTDLSVNSVVDDAKFVFDWLQNGNDGNNENKILVLGHSLGSAVATHLLSKYSDLKTCGLVLMAPFNNMADVIYLHSWTWPWRLLLPKYIFSWIFSPKKEVNFQPDHHIQNINSPILILHSFDDSVININLAKHLFKTKMAKVSKESHHVQFVELIKPYGHNEIYRAKELPGLLSKFNDYCL